MPTVTIDGERYEVREGRNMLQVALDHKLDLPYFCWHPAMGSVGACRLCAVKQYRDESDETGRLAMSCMTPAADGARISIRDPEATELRRSVIEWLMIDHPHDCPVCDEGGECHLQDMTVMTGHAHRRYRGRKRTFRNQYLGPFIHHEMNRCIQCYRCVRFYRDHAGGDDLGVFASKNHVYFGRVEDGDLQLPFSGNLVEVCPTGVFTDKTYRGHYTRKWDLQSAPSICMQCSLGCNTIPAARYGTLRRVTSRYNAEVNGYWLCDRGRFGYEHVNAGDRLRTARGRPWREAIVAVTGALERGTLAGVGSPRASLEANFALRRLVGPERFSPGLADVERTMAQQTLAAYRQAAVRAPSLQDIRAADAVLVLGADPTNEAPLLDLAIYRALQDRGAALVLVGLPRSRLSAFATDEVLLDPRRAAAFGHTVADAVAAGGVAADDVAAGGDPAARGDAAPGGAIAPNLPHDLRERAAATARMLRAAERPVVITGTQARHPPLLDAALRVAVAVSAARAETDPCGFSVALGDGNTLGVAILDEGTGPGFACRGPGCRGDGARRAGTDAAGGPPERHRGGIGLLGMIEAGEVDALVVCENDLFERHSDHARLEAALERLGALVVVDYLPSATAARAGWALPAATPEEQTGTTVNNEGRAQRFFQVLQPVEGARPSWAWVRDLPAAPDRGDIVDWQTVEDVAAAMAATQPVLAPAIEVAPPHDFRFVHQKIPRLPHRYSGRNAMPDLTDVRRHPCPPDDPETPLSFSMEGYPGHAPAPLLARVWAPGWNSNEAINQFQIEVGGPLHGGDPGRRLLEPPATPSRDAAGIGTVDWPGAPEGDVLELCAVAEIFGSDAISRQSPAIAEMSPSPYLSLHPDTASRLGLEAETRYRLRFAPAGPAPEKATASVVELVVDVDDSVPRHVALIPAGYPETRWWQEPVAVRLELLERLGPVTAPPRSPDPGASEAADPNDATRLGKPGNPLDPPGGTGDRPSGTGGPGITDDSSGEAS